MIYRLMMEFLDGVRVFWNGSKLYTKDLKTAIEVPKELAFPSSSFEGVLWYV
jgi:hypothetical protein